MTEARFLKEYHDWSTDDEMEAFGEALKIKLSDSMNMVVPVKIGDRYCLMLDCAVSQVGLRELPPMFDDALYQRKDAWARIVAELESCELKVGDTVTVENRLYVICEKAPDGWFLADDRRRHYFLFHAACHIPSRLDEAAR